jgi:hypothetical protein
VRGAPAAVARSRASGAMSIGERRKTVHMGRVGQLRYWARHCWACKSYWAEVEFQPARES